MVVSFVLSNGWWLYRRTRRIILTPSVFFDAVANAVTLALSLFILVMKIRYD
jgi:hypothetical protein